jgi:hypothetical protein
LNYDAPFVWLVVREKITCDATGAEVTYSDFPSMHMYRDDHLVWSEIQTPRLSDFIRSGGDPGVWHDIGDGNLDPVCVRRWFGLAGLAEGAPAQTCAVAVLEQ